MFDLAMSMLLFNNDRLSTIENLLIQNWDIKIDVTSSPIYKAALARWKNYLSSAKEDVVEYDHLKKSLTTALSDKIVEWLYMNTTFMCRDEFMKKRQLSKDVIVDSPNELITLYSKYFSSLLKQDQMSQTKDKTTTETVEQAPVKTTETTTVTEPVETGASEENDSENAQ